MDKNYWQSRYQKRDTPWDLGKVSGPIRFWADQIRDKEIKILVPGSGMGYEVEYLYKQGFSNVYYNDFVEDLLKRFKIRNPLFPRNQMLDMDVFALTETFDLILEQTFFCALPPTRREDYVLMMHRLLRPRGRLKGVLFDFPLSEKGPPFGGSIDEYEQLFGKCFYLHTLVTSAHSEGARCGKELIFDFEKR